MQESVYGYHGRKSNKLSLNIRKITKSSLLGRYFFQIDTCNGVFFTNSPYAIVSFSQMHVFRFVKSYILALRSWKSDISIKSHTFKKKWFSFMFTKQRKPLILRFCAVKTYFYFIFIIATILYNQVEQNFLNFFSSHTFYSVSCNKTKAESHFIFCFSLHFISADFTY